MKCQAVIVLLAIALAIAMPPSPPFTCGHAGHSTIGTLDVCHAATPALSSGGTMPCIQERPCFPLPLALKETFKAEGPLFKPLITVSRDERPPKA